MATNISSFWLNAEYRDTLIAAWQNARDRANIPQSERIGGIVNRKEARNEYYKDEVKRKR